MSLTSSDSAVSPSSPAWRARQDRGQFGLLALVQAPACEDDGGVTGALFQAPVAGKVLDGAEFGQALCGVQAVECAQQVRFAAVISTEDRRDLCGIDEAAVVDRAKVGDLE
jgi:hypothetical protein